MDNMILINGPKLKAVIAEWEQIGGYSEGEKNILRAVINEIEEAMENGPWIPVAEGLPEEPGEYLVTARWDVDEPYAIFIADYGNKIDPRWDGSHKVFQNGFAFGEIWGDSLDNLFEVTAWMPKQETYQS